jgi:hypothetical protein
MTCILTASIYLNFNEFFYISLILDDWHMNCLYLAKKQINQEALDEKTIFSSACNGSDDC